MRATAARQFADVIIDSAARELDRPFTYEVPEEMRADLQVGSVVLVPFSGRLSLGYVIGFRDTAAVDSMKPVAGLIDEPPLFDDDIQRLCRWISSRYLCPLSQAFRLVTPPGRSRRVRRSVRLTVPEQEALAALGERPGLRREIVKALASAGGELDHDALQAGLKPGQKAGPALRALEESGLVERRFAMSSPAASPRKRLAVRLLADPDEEARGALPPRQRELVELLLESGGSALQADLLRRTGASAGSLRGLEKKGLVEITGEEVPRQPWLGAGGPSPAPEPNAPQRAAIEAVRRAIEAREPETFLLEGVTGSGKTEVYLRAIRLVVESGRQAIMLVPEISLTPQTLERFESRFPGRVAVLHSRLGAGERFDQWRGVREGRYDVVVGARSALFAPVRDLGLIAIDEEHEASYKSDATPRYHAREVAAERARMAGAVLLLGSATPSFEALARARAGSYSHLRLPSRIDNRPMPDVEVVDMRQAGGAGTVPLLSAVMLDALSRTVDAGEQAILFLNRRGFANFLQCRSCGSIPVCGSCEVSLCYHSRGDMLMCHHCGSRRRVPDRCPSCGSGPLKTFGAGTQKVESELLSHLPGVRYIRMDADTTSGKDSHRRLLASFAAGEAQVLIGTQMIAKGLDIPGVTLVGVINADTALALPDFRAAERTFQLLTQVSGRAGRGLRPGRVVLQTFNPEHPAIRSLAGGSEAGFVEVELDSRLKAGYPPFIDLINVLVTSPDLPSAARAAERMRSLLDTDLARTGARVLGPAPAPLSRLRGQYRWHLVVKAPELAVVNERLKRSVARFYQYARALPAGRDVNVSIDVDPTSLL